MVPKSEVCKFCNGHEFTLRQISWYYLPPIWSCFVLSRIVSPPSPVLSALTGSCCPGFQNTCWLEMLGFQSGTTSLHCKACPLPLMFARPLPPGDNNKTGTPCRAIVKIVEIMWLRQSYKCHVPAQPLASVGESFLQELLQTKVQRVRSRARPSVWWHLNSGTLPREAHLALDGNLWVG